MADYYSLLSRAVANLPKTSPPAARAAIYDRARKALTTQLRSLKPKLPESDIAREENALDVAVARIEAEYDPSAPAPPPPAPPPPQPEPPVRVAPPRAAVAPQAPVRPNTPVAPTPRPTAPPPIRPAPPINPARPAAPPPVAPGPKPIQTPAAYEAEMSAPPPPAPPIAAPRSAPVEPPTPPPVVSKPAPENERAPKVASNFEAPPARDGAEALRPVAPAPSVQRKGSPWPWIAAGALVLVVGTVAVAAFLSRQKPADLAITETSQVTPPSPSPTSTGPKIVERVGGTAAQPAPSDTPAPAPAPTVAPSPAPTVAASPTPAASAAPAPAPSQTAAPAPAPSTATLPVSARAAMLVANNGDTAKPVVSLGSVVWTAAAANPGQPGSSGVKAEIDVPELKLHASMVLRKNVDPSLPASHTIDLRVTFDDGATVRGVKDIALPQMRREDPPGVTALAGVRVKINDGYFLIGLNRNDADITRNIDALVNNGWLDFPMLLPDERIAKLTFEKGPDGTRLMNEAVAAWK